MKCLKKKKERKNIKNQNLEISDIKNLRYEKIKI